MTAISASGRAGHRRRRMPARIGPPKLVVATPALAGGYVAEFGVEESVTVSALPNGRASGMTDAYRRSRVRQRRRAGRRW